MKLSFFGFDNSEYKKIENETFSFLCNMLRWVQNDIRFLLRDSTVTVRDHFEIAFFRQEVLKPGSVRIFHKDPSWNLILHYLMVYWKSEIKQIIYRSIHFVPWLLINQFYNARPNILTCRSSSNWKLRQFCLNLKLYLKHFYILTYRKYTNTLLDIRSDSYLGRTT